MKEPFADLDALVDSGASFRFRGKIYKLKPIDAGTFMSFMNRWAELQELLQKDKLEGDEAMVSSVNIIQSVCDIEEDLIRKEMTVAQTGAVIQLIVDSVQGKIEKKKIPLREPLTPRSNQYQP